MFTISQTDRLAGPYALGVTGETSDRLADVVDGPHLPALLAERYEFGTESAATAATAINAALHDSWRATAYGEDYAGWIGRMPDSLLKCVVDTAARAEDDEFGAVHELRMARLILSELAVVIRHR
ncbi:hypothetical protein ACFWVC_26935 [Streptomyces sp. NPDC058691]|uniref:hypothetical protein n=1 Tax=Streptomyces sp. NPDC058691 TaxID=3346601 RepID=UPI00365DB831